MNMEPLKIGLIGCGGISGAHMRAYREHPDKIRLVAVCDVVADNARRRAAELGGVSVYADLNQMLREADMQAVDICTIHDQHAGNAIAALQAGKHVLVEKPMACSLRECRDMIAAADKADRILMVAQMQRYDPSYQALKNIIQSGELGPIRAVRIDAMQNGPEVLTGNAWLLDGRRAGGGIVISVAVHRIDLVRYLVGEITRVTAVTRCLHPVFKNGAEDYAVAILEFANGAIGELFGTYSGFRQPYSEMFMIFGDDGAVHSVPQLGRGGGPAFVASRRRSEPFKKFDDMFQGFFPVAPEPGSLPTGNPFCNELLHFSDCCRTGREPLSSGRDNLGTMKVIFGIYESARRGSSVELKDI